MKRRVQKVVVVGSDAPAWMAAAAIHGSLSSTGVRVRVIEVPTLLQPVNVYCALPALAGFHHRVGLDEQLLFNLCKAVPIAGQRFSNWSGAMPPFIHGYDRPPPAGGGDLGFIQLWIKGRQKGLRTGWENFSPGAMAARAGRVPLPVDSPELQATFGYNIDARVYSALLRHLVARAGVEAKSALVSNIEVENDRIAALMLADGERIEADLFVDASGPQAILIDRMPRCGFETWRQLFPCDRIMIASGKRLQPYPAFSQISAIRQGWMGLFPLQDRTAVVAAYDSGEASEKEILASLPVHANLPISGDAVVSNLAQGIRNRTWVGNCVAVGEAAFSLEPLDAVQLHIAHYCITQLMTLFPAEADTFPEAEVYDDMIRRAAVNLRDFQLARYKLNRRFDQPLWDRCRDAGVPETLQRKLDVFAARGRVPLYDEETFQEHDWQSLLIGQGLMPQSYDPRVDGLPEQAHIAQVQGRLEAIASLVESMPYIDDFIASYQLQSERKVDAGT